MIFYSLFIIYISKMSSHLLVKKATLKSTIAKKAALKSSALKKSTFILLLEVF